MWQKVNHFLKSCSEDQWRQLMRKWFENKDIKKGKELSIFDNHYRNQELFSNEFCKEIFLPHSNNLISITKIAEVGNGVATPVDAPERNSKHF